MLDVVEVAERARTAALRMSIVEAETKNMAIQAIAEEIDNKKDQLILVNAKDVENAVKAGLASPLVKRLKLDAVKVNEMTMGLRSLVKLSDPVGRVLLATEMDRDLELYKVACPIGVIGAVFESRPDALVQIAALCLKSGNVVILKGGSEASQTNQFLAELIRRTIQRYKEIPADTVQLVETREAIDKLLKLDEYVDLLVPRGSGALVKYIKDNTRIPVLGHT